MHCITLKSNICLSNTTLDGNFKYHSHPNRVKKTMVIFCTFFQRIHPKGKGNFS